MREPSIDRQFGRQAFGVDPGGYHAARPAYPDGCATGKEVREFLFVLHYLAYMIR